MKTRSNVVNLALSWLGKNEVDGSYKTIVDIYNSYKPLPRNTKMQYGWAWCACTWSALAIKLGYTSIMPIEISCYYLIENAKKMGCWNENDAYVPKPGDGCLYDWDDSGKGDCTGNPDHVGVVVSVDASKKTFVVVEGNYSDSVKKRTMSVNGRYIRGFICPKYDEEASTSTATTTAKTAEKKSIDEVAREVIAGKWGVGAARMNALNAAGYNYSDVQARVNILLSGKAAKSVTEIAKEVIAGKWGNGSERKRKLTQAGYDYAAVQKRVNELCK